MYAPIRSLIFPNASNVIAFSVLAAGELFFTAM
jgi:hypothetical protein